MNTNFHLSGMYKIITISLNFASNSEPLTAAGGGRGVNKDRSLLHSQQNDHSLATYVGK